MVSTERISRIVNSSVISNLRSVFGAKSFKRVHRRLSLGVEVAGFARASDNVSVTLVDHHVYLAVNALLRENDGILEELSFRAEIHAVV